MALTKNDEAVSPVIGTVLMVAITVILAAVIAMYVFGMPGGITKTKVVAVTAQMDTNKDILITYQGGQDDDTLSSLNITAPDGSTSSTLGKPIIGAPIILPGPWQNSQNHVMVVGTFSDGVHQIILDTYL